MGGIQAGAFKMGDSAGTAENVAACKLYRPGSVGFVSKSGGLSNECYNILSQVTDGLFEVFFLLVLNIFEILFIFTLFFVLYLFLIKIIINY